MRQRKLSVAAGVVLLALLTACGGGGSSSSRSSSGSGSAGFTITTDSALPGTLQSRAYSATLSAANGSGSLSWSIKPISSTALFVDGLSIDSSTGVLSGTVNFGGTAGFVANVSDSASPVHTASKTFTITATEPLQALAPQASSVAQFVDVPPIVPVFQGGVSPFRFSLGGSLPPGLRFDPATGQISGSPTALGAYAVSVIIQDSFSPAEVVSEQLTITVMPPPMVVANSLPSRMLQNRPFNGRVIVTGGTPPYQISIVAGSLPPGLSPIDPSSGQTNGTPTTLGVFAFTVRVADSSSPAQSVNGASSVTIAPPLGRNDTVATATPIGNGAISASISPYIDPPGNAPFAADGDYYKLVSLPTVTAPIHLESQTSQASPGAPLDTVMEIVDGNGNRLSACRQPGDTSLNFTSSCINDDIGGSPRVLDSALDFEVQGNTNTSTTFYVHVLDWRGNARPDMNYSLQVSGLIPPLGISVNPLLPAARGLSYAQQLTTTNGMGISWTIASGSLPPVLKLDSTGLITGVPTTDGTYSFSVRATDSETSAQTATSQETIQVVDPIQITSPATLPDACLNQAYSFAVQTSGGIPPLIFDIVPSLPGITLNESTGVFSGVPTAEGTFQSGIVLNDGTVHPVIQHVTLTVKQCP